jgi:glycosyltransferase involved in cell wall biosynthesis
MKKKIILSANTSWYLFNFRASTIQAFINLKHEVICIAPEDEYTQKLKNLGCTFIPISMDNKGINPLKDIYLLLQFLRYYFKVKPDVIFHFTIKNNIYGTWAAKILSIPAINNISGLGTAFLSTGLLSTFVKILYKTSQCYAYKVFCQNSEDLHLLSTQRLVPAQNLVLLPGSGVNLQRFHPNLRSMNGNQYFTFLYAGRMLKDKGLYELIEAIQSINQNSMKCNLRLCGFANADNRSSIPISKLEEWKNMLGIEWIGPSDDVELVMAEADCLVLPSYREGMPKTILEAGAMELPVIASNVPGCKNIIQNGVNGVLCRPRDSADLKNAMLLLMGMSDEERAIMGKAGRAKVKEEFDEKIVINFATNALNELLSVKL